MVNTCQTVRCNNTEARSMDILDVSSYKFGVYI